MIKLQACRRFAPYYFAIINQQQQIQYTIAETAHKIQQTYGTDNYFICLNSCLPWRSRVISRDIKNEFFLG